MLNEILKLCHDGTRLVPKRNLKWLGKTNSALYDKICSLFPETALKDVVGYLQHGINSANEIPGCTVCGKPVHLLRDKLLSECSVSCAQKSTKVKDKIKTTCQEKYGVDRYFGEKPAGVLGEHYLQKHLKNLDDVNNHEVMTELSEKSWTEVAEHFGLTQSSHSSAHKFMQKYGYPIKAVSGFSHVEIEVKDYIKSLGFDPVSTRQIIKPYELDIYISEKNLAIEFNGLYWHSSGSKETDKEKSKYHLMKTDMCESKGIQLLHIFENEWNDPVKREIWKSVIRHKLGLSKSIGARKCKVKEITTKEANTFIKLNHLQGSAAASLAFGLFLNEVLVQVVTLGKPRYSNGYDYELIRMCTKIGMCVQGGASKLLSRIDGKIISYGNRRWCSTLSNVYDKVMKFGHVSPPCYWYVDDGELYHRSSFMKHKLKDKLQTFDDKMTEVENCYANGLRRIWDCGNLVYSNALTNE